MDTAHQVITVRMLRTHAKIKAGNSFGKPVVSVVSTHTGSVHISKYLGPAQVKGIVITQTRYGTAVQQYYGCFGAERLLPSTESRAS